MKFDKYLWENNPELYKELTKRGKDMAPKKITKRFYVGSNSMNPLEDGGRYNDWAHATLDEAVKHAAELADENDASYIVVQIVRVVRRAKRPVIVEKV